MVVGSIEANYCIRTPAGLFAVHLSGSPEIKPIAFKLLSKRVSYELKKPQTEPAPDREHMIGTLKRKRLIRAAFFDGLADALIDDSGEISEYAGSIYFRVCPI